MKKTILLLAFLFGFMPVYAADDDNSIVDNRQHQDIFANAITSYGKPSDRDFNFQLYFKKIKLDGDMKIKGEPHAPETVSMSNLSNLDDEYAIGSRLKMALGYKTIGEISYIQFEHSGNLISPKAFNGYKLKTGAKFNMKSRFLDVMFKQKMNKDEELVNDRYDSFLVGGIRTLNTILTARGPQTGTTDRYVYANWEKTFPILYVGVDGGMKLGRDTKINGHLLFSSFPTTDGYDAQMYDMGANFTFDFPHNNFGNILQLELGYNNEKYDIDGHGNKINFKLSAPYASLNLLF